MTTRYLTPNQDPPSREDYDLLYAQFIALILSTGKTSITVPHSIRHPLTESAGVLIVEKQVDSNWTIYTVAREP